MARFRANCSRKSFAVFGRSAPERILHAVACLFRALRAMRQAVALCSRFAASIRATLRGYVLPAFGRCEHTPRRARYVLPALPACGRQGRCGHTRAFFGILRLRNRFPMGLRLRPKPDERPLPPPLRSQTAQSRPPAEATKNSYGQRAAIGGIGERAIREF